MTSFFKKWALAFCLAQFSLFAVQIESFYGPLEIDEPVLCELIESPAFQRLKSIHQYGACYYTTYPEEYTRYDHSIGVFAILREKGSSLEEQIAGLLHDVSHTAFSHVGDQIFANEYQGDDYQSSIHQAFLEKTGLDTILRRYGFSAFQMLPNEKTFPALEQQSPDLCADRIDYNIQGAFHQGFLTHEEAKQLLANLQFTNGHWIGTDRALLKKLVRSSLFMTQDCWGGATNYIISTSLASAIKRAMEIEIISREEVHFGTDQMLWDRLVRSEDPVIKQQMQRLFQADKVYCLVEPSKADIIVKSKFRGIDPWILSEGTIIHLTELDSALADEYNTVKEKVLKGWCIKFLEK